MYKVQGTLYVLFRKIMIKLSGGPYEFFPKIHMNEEDSEELFNRKKVYKKFFQKLYPIMIIISIFLYKQLRYRDKCSGYSKLLSVKFVDGKVKIPCGYKDNLTAHYGDYMTPAKKGEYKDLTAGRR